MIEVRKAFIGDEAHLAGLAQSVQQLHVAHRADHFRPTEIDALTAWYRDQLATPRIAAWLATVEGRSVGYALAIQRERPANLFVNAFRWVELDQLCVDPNWQRRGVGSALLQMVLADAAAQRIADIELNVWAFNNDALQFFEAAGFTIARRRLEMRRPQDERE